MLPITNINGMTNLAAVGTSFLGEPRVFVFLVGGKAILAITRIFTMSGATTKTASDRRCTFFSRIDVGAFYTSNKIATTQLTLLLSNERKKFRDGR